MKALFSHQNLQQNYARIEHTALQQSPIYQELNNRLLDRVQDANRKFEAALDISLHTQLDHFSPAPQEQNTHDLILANMTLCWVNDLRDFLLNTGKALRPDGLFLASTLGIESFREFRLSFEAIGAEETGHVIPLSDVRALGSLMQSIKFAMPVIDRDIITLSYPNFESIYADLKAHGARNLNPNRQKGLMGKNTWKKMEAYYTSTYALEDGSLPVTLEVIYLSGWRPGPNQQKPLSPGSATVNLKDIL